jgi:large subunit ribosomal protein L17
MFRNLAANLINHERIVTTDAKAKELRRVAERLITKAKRLGEVAYTPNEKLDEAQRSRRLHVSRLLGGFLPRWAVDRDGETKKDLIEKVMVELSQRFKERPGGYTRIIKLGPRRGDGASMCQIELVDAPSPLIEDEPEVEAEQAAPAPEAKADEKAAKADTKAAKAEAKADDDEPAAEDKPKKKAAKKKKDEDEEE